MKRLLIAFALLLSGILRAATGDIVSCTVLANGWEADIVITGLNTGGTYAMGLGANNEPFIGNTPKITFTVVSLGYDDAGAATTITRTIYGTTPVRKAFVASFTQTAYPNEESNDGTNTTVRVALSDYIFQKDNTGGGNSGTAPVVNILSGFYTKTAVPNNASGAGFAVTNNSTLAYPSAVANWSRPGYQLTGSTVTLGAVAFHSSGQSGRPVRAVKFTVTGLTSAVTATAIVLSPTYDSTYGDAVPVVEYIVTVNLSGMTQGENLQFDFAAYPWTGDSGAVLDTSTAPMAYSYTATQAAPSPLPSSQFGLCDKNGTYGQTVAVVSTAGNDGTGAVVDLASFNPASPPAAYLTINKAASAIAAYNNANHSSRNNAGGGIIYVRYDAAGSHAWTGASNAVPVSPVPYAPVTVTTFPGDTQAVIDTQSGNKHLGATTPIVLRNLNLTLGVNTGSISGFLNLLVDQCTINNSTGSAVVFYQINRWDVIRSTVTSIVQGLKYFTGGFNLSLCRGNTITNTLGSNHIYTWLGNINSGAVSSNTFYTSTSPLSRMPIFAFNKDMKYSNVSNAAVKAFMDSTETTGIGGAFIQNLVESISGQQGTYQIASDGTTNSPVNNVLIWNCTDVGAKCNLQYDEVGDTSSTRTLWSLKNNVFEDYNIKSDTFTHTSTSITRVATVATLTFTAHGFQAGDMITVTGASPAAYNVAGAIIASVTANTIVYPLASDPGSSATVQGAFGAFAGRVGNWSGLYGVGFSGNLWGECSSIGAPTDFESDFCGLRGYQPPANSGNYPSGYPNQHTANATAYFAFTSRQAYTGSPGTGNGTYTLTSTSPAKASQLTLLVPYDMAGTLRNTPAAAGAYVYPAGALAGFWWPWKNWSYFCLPLAPARSGRPPTQSGRAAAITPRLRVFRPRTCSPRCRRF